MSHQWVDSAHPDPDFRQFRVLQDALRHLLFSDVTHVPLDATTEGAWVNLKRLSVTDFTSKPLSFWYDYFSCPQLESAVSGEQSNLAHAISSIPAYVAKCSFFLALCPVIDSPSMGKVFSAATWSKRGWCRLERICRELSENGSWILIQSKTRLQLLGTPLAFPSGGSVGEGEFTVEGDRAKLLPVLRQLLMRKVRFFARAQDLVGYRLLLNMYSVHLRGLSAEPQPELLADFEPDSRCTSLLTHFLYENGFQSVRSVDMAGFSPLHYAAVGGNPELVRDLLKQRADIDRKTRQANAEMGLLQWMSSLDLSIFYHNNDVVQVLLSARARHTGGLMPAIVLAAIQQNVEGLRMLCEQTTHSPLTRNLWGFTAFECACIYSNGDLATVAECVRQDRLGDKKLGPLEFSRALVLSAGVAVGCTPAVVQYLLEPWRPIYATKSSSNFHVCGL